MFRHLAVKSRPLSKQQESTAFPPVFVRVFTLSSLLNFHKAIHSCSNSFSFRASLGAAGYGALNRAAASLFLYTLCHFLDI
jgi:hypothetical protein